jgi:hypothetical protein
MIGLVEDVSMLSRLGEAVCTRDAMQCTMFFDTKGPVV